MKKTESFDDFVQAANRGTPYLHMSARGDSVKQEQTRCGSRRPFARMEEAGDRFVLTEQENWRP